MNKISFFFFLAIAACSPRPNFTPTALPVVQKTIPRVEKMPSMCCICRKKTGFYEAMMPIAATVAARMNAENGANYDPSRFLNWGRSTARRSGAKGGADWFWSQPESDSG